ncbi:HlyD family secretion protein [Salinarimonas sp.]|uniref:HlyD family secretion protein n=1 Tax=Salinarimonas sp. TaxID=2766526 RepID=UPI00391A905D
MIWNNRFVRIAVGLALLATAILVLLPGLTGHTSLDGTVNARFAVISAPIEGIVADTPPKVGSRVADGEPLVALHNDRVNRAILTSLAAERNTALERVAALERQRGSLEALARELEDRVVAYRTALIADLRQELEILRGDMEVSRAQESAAASELLRRETLGTSGIVAESAIEQARAAQVFSGGRVETARLQAERIENRLVALEQGVFVGDGQNDVPYSRQRRDELLVQIADIDQRIAENRTRADEIGLQLAEETRRVETLADATVVSPFGGVVWRNNVVDGSNVVVGQEMVRLLDCRDLFVDILVPEVDYDVIYPGRSAEVRLLGRESTLDGRVLSVRGSAAVVEEVTLAATPPAGVGRNARIRVALAASDLNDDFDNYCQVGRSVQVRFQRDGLPLRRWLQSLWFSIS